MNISDVLSLTFSFIVAFLMAFAATPVVRVFAYKFGAIDVPKDERRMHKEAIPRLGGVAIFYGFIISVFCFVEIDRPLMGILIGAVLITGLGVIDDIMDVKAWIKLIVQILAALIVVRLGVRIDRVTNPFPAFWQVGEYIDFGMWSVPVTVFWIVGVTNAVNFIDGLDGLAVGISSITAITLFTISLLMGEYSIACVNLALAGAGFGFLPFNFYPAKIFMGDAGSTFLGFMLACISILGLFKVYAVISFAVPFLILALPIFDTGFAIIRRVVRGRSPMKADRGHLHHRLIDMGFTQKRAVVILYVASAMLSMSAIVLMISGAPRAMVLMGAVLVLILSSKKIIISAMENGE